MLKNVLPILRKLEQKTRSPFVGVVIAFIFCGIVGIAINASETNNGQRDQMMEPRFPSAAELYPQALQEAQTWQSDAYLTSVFFRFSDVRMLLSLGFNTLSNPKSGLVVYFWLTEDGYETELSETESPGWTEPRPGIEREDWQIDSVEAARVAFEFKGLDFLDEHPEVDEAILQLTRVSGSAAEDTGLTIGRIVWVMHYYQMRGYELRVYVDPNTGEIIGERFFEPGFEGELKLD